MSSALPALLLITSGAALGASVCALAGLRGTRRQLAALRAELAAAGIGVGRVPAARPAPDAAIGQDTIRAAVAAALADERERELAEARAFWAAQEAREAAEAPLFDGRADLGTQPFLPRPADLVGLEGPESNPFTDEADEQNAAGLGEALHAAVGDPAGEDPHGLVAEEATADRSAASRRHPSDPGFVPAPVVADPAATIERLTRLAEERTPLTDVRPGPMGTLDVYAFEDGTTLCVTPGDSLATGRLVEYLRADGVPVLLGGSGLGGAFALTFDLGGESVYVLADRIVASS